ncbi:MAG: PEP-CTERM sorting domain-containing protein [Gammaproteobacteria bacterium]|jgi:hypothetical protein
MKKLLTGLSVALLSLVSVNANALYVDTVDVYTIINSGGGSSSVSWTHSYDGSEDPIAWATLTITAEDVDGASDSVGPELIQASFNGNILGTLETQGFYSPGSVSDITAGAGVTGGGITGLSTTVFNLDPSWIMTGMDVNNATTIEVLGNWWAEIETATLTIASVPEPETVFLLGLALLGLLIPSLKYRQEI